MKLLEFARFIDKNRPPLGSLPVGKKKPLDSLMEIQDHFDQIRGTNHNLTDNQILEIVAKATGQSLSMVKKRWKLMSGIDWPIIDYIERGVIGMNRAMTLIDNDLSVKERVELMNQSLDEKITDSGFKEYMQKYLEKKAEEEE